MSRLLGSDGDQTRLVSECKQALVSANQEVKLDILGKTLSLAAMEDMERLVVTAHELDLVLAKGEARQVVDTLMTPLLHHKQSATLSVIQ